MCNDSVRPFIIAACLFAGGLSCYTLWVDAGPERKIDENWAAEHIEECRRIVLGSPSCADRSIRGINQGSVIKIQAWTDDFLDILLEAGLAKGEITSLRIVVAANKPFFDQLRQLHSENPESDPADIFKLVRVREIELNPDQSAQLTPILVDLCLNRVRDADIDADVTIWLHGLDVTTLVITGDECYRVRLSLPRTDAADGYVIGEADRRRVWELLRWLDDQLGLWSGP